MPSRSLRVSAGTVIRGATPIDSAARPLGKRGLSVGGTEPRRTRATDESAGKQAHDPWPTVDRRPTAGPSRLDAGGRDRDDGIGARLGADCVGRASVARAYGRNIPTSVHGGSNIGPSDVSAQVMSGRGDIVAGVISTFKWEFENALNTCVVPSSR
jgi:hypothetical protein